MHEWSNLHVSQIAQEIGQIHVRLHFMRFAACNIGISSTSYSSQSLLLALWHFTAMLQNTMSLFHFLDQYPNTLYSKVQSP